MILAVLGCNPEICLIEQFIGKPFSKQPPDKDPSVLTPDIFDITMDVESIFTNLW